VKKSTSVTVTLMASMALVACGPGRRCVDQAGQPAPDVMCEGPRVAPGYHWIVIPASRTLFRSGGVGSTAPSSSGVSRGGFGSTGGGHSSGSGSAS
jgi:uncharacterized membrane protein YgcG